MPAIRLAVFSLATAFAFALSAPPSLAQDQPLELYRSALSSFEAGDTQGARAALEAIDHAAFLLGDWSAYDLARLNAASGDREVARALLEETLLRRPASPARGETFDLLLTVACVEPADAACGRALDLSPSGGLSAETRARRALIEAQRLEAAGEAARAYRGYQEVYYHHPLSQSAEQARRATQRLLREAPAAQRAQFPNATFDMRMNRARALAAAGAYDRAVEEFRRILGIGYRGARLAEARFALGETLNRARRRPEARAVFAELAARHAASPLALASRYEMAVIDWNLGAAAKASAQLAPLAADGVPDPLRRRALFTLGKIAEREDGAAAAMEYYRGALALAPEGGAARTLRWRLAWAVYRGGQYEQAAALFAESYSKTDPVNDDGGALYWQARALEKTGREAQAAELFRTLAIRHPDGYYALRGDMRGLSLILNLTEPTLASTYQFSIGEVPAEAGENLARFEALLELGQTARAEFEADAMRRTKDAADSPLWLGQLYLRAGASAKAMRLAGQALAARPVRDDFGDPIWRLLYPADLASLVAAPCVERGLDPFLALAIIRQESGFDRLAVSSANARGLMQIIPATGRRVYEQIGLESRRGAPFHHDALFEPEVNVTLGVTHFAGLLARYQGSVALALAAYNAGETAVEAWLREGPAEPEDEFIERIPYAETREYVKKVIRNWALYRKIYPQHSGAPDGAA
ncbi:MAG: lytic transglycosylase domain-containing protein [Nitrospinae bacterium]|nr:lytic transglycosylase domain-containing protein [Nitrospinota bacterium]